MKTNKKQTALSWLKDQIKDIQPYELACTIEQYIDEAKQIEREQIVNAWKEDRVMVFFDDKGDDLSEEDIQELAKKYYEETYGK